MKKILLLMFCMILLIGNVSAGILTEWNDKLDYENNDMTVVITNWFGLGEKLGEATLTSHSSATEIRKVLPGENRAVMYYEFNDWEKYPNGLGKVIFKNMRDEGNEVTRDYYFAKAIYETQTYPRYERDCKNVLLGNGTIEQQCTQINTENKSLTIIRSWEKLETNEIPTGNTTIGLITEVKSGDYFDGVWTIAGKKVVRHAEWIEAYNLNLPIYINFSETGTRFQDNTGNENNGSRSGSVTSTTGIIGNGVNFDGTVGQPVNFPSNSTDFTLGTGDFTFRIWIKPSTYTCSGGGGADCGILYDNINSAKLSFRIQSDGAFITQLDTGCANFVTTNTTGWDFTEWTHLVFRRDSGNFTIWKNASIVGEQACAGADIEAMGYYLGTRPQGPNDQLFVGDMDEFTMSNESWSDTRITADYNDGVGITHTLGPFDTTPPNVTANTPTNDTFGTSVTFNVTALDDLGMSDCKYTIDNGGTNFTMTNATTSPNDYTDTNSTMSVGSQNVQYFCTDVEGNENNSISTSFFTIASPEVNLITPTNNTNSSSSSLTFNCNSNDTSGILQTDLIIDGILNFSITNSSAGENLSLETTIINLGEGSHTWTCNASNGISPMNGTTPLRTFSIDTIFPDINMTYPENITYIIDITRANYTFTETNCDKAWFSSDGGASNGTPVNCGINFTGLTSAQGDNTWTIYINDTFGNENSSIVSFFKDDISPTIVITTPTNHTNSTNNNLDINFSAADTNLQACWYSNDSFISNTTITCGQNITNIIWTEGVHRVIVWVNDSLGNEAQNSTNFTIDSILPVIDVETPRGIIDSYIDGNNLTLNWSVSDLNLQACWFEYNFTNTTLTCGDNTFSFLPTSQQNLTFYANDTYGNENANFTSWTFAFVESGIGFEGNVSETDLQSFEINLTTSLTILSISATLNYNGTNHISTTTCSEQNCTLSNSIDIPLVLVGEEQTNTFFWEISIFNGTDSIQINTSENVQNVSRIHLETCNASFTTIGLNFTAQNEINLTRVNPFRFDGTFGFWLGTGDTRRNNSFTNASTDEVNLCLTPNDTMFVDAQIEYNEPLNVSFVTRNYYFQNNSISNVAQHIPLFLLPTDDSTTFILKVQDDELLALPDHLILIQRFYPGENLFRTVQIAKTDDNGKSLGFFQTEIPDYRFIISKDGLVLLTTSQQKIFPETSPFTLTFTIGADLGTPLGDLEEIDDLTFTLDFNKTSNIITYTYVDTNTSFTLGRLVVERQNVTFSTNNIICDVNSTLASATLICDVGTETTNQTGVYTASGTVIRDEVLILVSVKNFILETITSIMGLLGVFMAFFIIFIASFAFKFNEIAGIFMINAAIIFVNIIGLVSFGMLSITAIIGVSILIVAVIER
jgi:hypothetical protein